MSGKQCGEKPEATGGRASARENEKENAKTKNHVWMEVVFLDYFVPWLES